MLTFAEKMFKLAQDMETLAEGFTKDGYNPSQSYEYVKAQQYKAIFRKALHNNRLRHKIDDAVCEVSPALKSDKMVLTQYHGVLTILDVDSDAKETYMLWSQGSDSLDKGLSKAKTLAIKDFIKSNFLIGDSEDDPEADASTKKPTFVAQTDKKKIADKVVKDEKLVSQDDVERIKNAILLIREKSGETEYGEATMKEIGQGITESRASVILTKLEMKANKYELEI